MDSYEAHKDSIAATIPQIIQISESIGTEIDGLRMTTDNIPDVYRNITLGLYGLVSILKATKEANAASAINESKASVFLPVIDGCLKLVKSIDQLIEKALAKERIPAYKKAYKAVAKLRYEAKMQEKINEIKSCTLVLQFDWVVSNILLK